MPLEITADLIARQPPEAPVSIRLLLERSRELAQCRDPSPHFRVPAPGGTMPCTMSSLRGV